MQGNLHSQAGNGTLLSTKEVRGLFLVVLLSLLLLPLPGHLPLVPAGVAQAQDAGLNARRFLPSPGSALNYNQVAGTELPGHLVSSFGVFFDYGYRPLVASRGDEAIDLIQQAMSSSLQGALGLGKRFQLGLSMPLTVYQASKVTVENAYVPELSPWALGDLVIEPKALFLKGNMLSMALAVPISVPTGDSSQYQGEAGLTFEPRAILELRGLHLRTAFNLGFLARQSQTLFGITSRNELRAGGVLAYAAPGDRLTFLAEVFGGVGLNTETELALESPGLELNLSGRYAFKNGHNFTLGAGPGVGNQFGTPAFRAFLGYAYAPVNKKKIDSDSDGIADTKDTCPKEPEDADSFQDDDGCPEPDNDQDGLLDAKDRCPTEPEDLDKFQDDDGCVDADNDQDGIADADDKCPLQLEKAGRSKRDGCPDVDQDTDGVADDVDLCPNVKSAPENDANNDGCLDDDSDGDAIPLAKDLCPRKPEDLIPPFAGDGCPSTEPWLQQPISVPGIANAGDPSSALQQVLLPVAPDPAQRPIETLTSATPVPTQTADEAKNADSKGEATGANADATAQAPETPAEPSWYERIVPKVIRDLITVAKDWLAALEKKLPMVAKMGGSASTGMAAGFWLAKGGPRSALNGLRSLKDLKKSGNSSKKGGKTDLKGMQKKLDQLVKMSDWLAEQTNIEAFRDVSGYGKDAQRVLKVRQDLKDRVDQVKNLSKDMKKLVDTLQGHDTDGAAKKTEDAVPVIPFLRVNVSDNRLELLERISFAEKSAEVKPEDQTTLELVLSTLKAHPKITRIGIEGYTDSEGDEAQSAALSMARAQAVLKRLVDAGADASRLQVVPCGEARPISKKGTPEGKKDNRRVEFLVLHIDGQPLPGRFTDPPTVEGAELNPPANPPSQPPTV